MTNWNPLAEQLIAKLKPGQVIGIGTGSTVDGVLPRFAEAIKEQGNTVRVVPTSLQSSWNCAESGLTVLDPSAVAEIDWGFDGADEVDAECRLIKGRGAALLWEKIVARRCKKFIVIVDQNKIVSTLGEKMAVPVEVIPGACQQVVASLVQLGAKEVQVRYAEALERKFLPFTQQGNLLIDARFSPVADSLEAEIQAIPGVVDCGLFVGITTEVLVVDKLSGAVEEVSFKG